MARIDAVRTLAISTALLSSLGGSRAWARIRGDFNGDGFNDLVIGVPLEDIDAVSDAGAVHVIYGSGSKLKASHDQFWSANSDGVMGVAETDAQFGASIAAGDFDGDGFDDLAIGAPFEDVNSNSDAGAVHVLYGSSSGLSTHDQLWTQDSPGILEAADDGDSFGFSVIAGDFDGDGRDDLAIGAPFEDSENFFDSGAVNVLFGGSHGLRASGDDLIHEDSPGVAGMIDGNDFFGYILATGDFDGDGHDDLVIGSPNDVVDGADSGSLNVMYGSIGGLNRSGDQRWTQNTPGIHGAAELDDRFAHALATGDFDNDGFDDLAIGVPGDTVDPVPGAGGVHIFYGSSNRLRASDTEFWSQDSSGVNDAAELDDQFGTSLAAGDFNNDGFSDLAIGIPLEALSVGVDVIPDCGAVAVLYGSRSGLRSNGDQFFNQSMLSASHGIESFDHFGLALTAGDYNGDGRDDLVIAAPKEDIFGADDGAVHVLYGSGSKLKTAGAQLWTQDSAGINDHAEDNDWLGISLGR